MLKTFLNHSVNEIIIIIILLSPRNAAICPRTFSSNVDGKGYGHAGDTSSDVPSMNVQSKTIGFVQWEFHCALARI
jgi:hypothetical protein